MAVLWATVVEAWQRQPRTARTLCCKPCITADRWVRPRRNGTQYISTIESTRYPFFGTQWHPEKPPYEFSDKTIPHSIDAIRVSQHTSNAFVEVARRSSHR